MVSVLMLNVKAVVSDYDFGFLKIVKIVVIDYGFNLKKSFKTVVSDYGFVEM